MTIRNMLLAAALAAGLGGCAAPSSVDGPGQGGGDLEGHVVKWSTDEPTLGAVLYRFPGESAYRRVAYPRAAIREDKTYATAHEIPLLGVERGDTVFVQIYSRAADGRVTRSDEQRFVVGERPAAKPLLRWTMIDVGFGDSHYLVMPTSGRRILIDAGERRDWPNVDTFLDGEGVARLDVVAGTHVHADHVGGMVGDFNVADDGVLGQYEIGVFLDSPTKSADRSAYDEMLGILGARGIPVAVVHAGETDLTNPRLEWDDAVRVEVFNSGHGAAIGGSFEGDWLNNDSIVFRLTFGQVNLLLGGDAEGPVESKMVREHAENLDSEVLKVHHHGVDDASGSTFLATVNPRVGLIPITSYESNSGTLPTTTVLDRLRAEDVDIYASDRAEPLGYILTGSDGFNVTVQTDGQSYEVIVVPSRSVHYSGDFAPHVHPEPKDCLR